MVLEKMTKAELASKVENHPAYVWSEHPPMKWTKAELIQWLIEADIRRR